MNKIKKILFVLLCIMFFPYIVNATEYCKVVSGEGKEIGSEISCGTEHFYIIENNNNTLKLLAKYNLLVGDKIDFFQADNTVNNYSNAEDYCFALATRNNFNAYYVYPTYDESNRLTGCRAYEKINYTRVLQDERAVGTKLDGNGKSILPLYGITYMNPLWGYDAYNGIIHTNEYDANGDLILEGSSFEEYINGYKTELLRQDVPVENVSFITLDKTLDLLEEISGRNVEVNLISDENVTNPEDAYVGKMDIKGYLTNNERWLYDITYWLGSGFAVDGMPNTFMDYYISNEGMLCAIGRGECVYLPYPIGNGVRPVITVSKSNVKYSIITETDGNGTIQVVDSSFGGEEIRFKTTAKKGYKLTSIVIKTDTGELVEFSEGEIINNSDGTISVDKNKFTMPFQNVIIQAKWSLENPSTGRNIMLAFIIIALIGGSAFVMKQNIVKE